MAFDEVVGQNRVKEILSAGIKKDRISHAYLFTGPEGAGMDAMALALGRSLLCLEKSDGGCLNCQSCRRFEVLEHPAVKIVMPVPAKPKGMKEEKYQEILFDRRHQWVANPYLKLIFTPELSGLPVIGIDQIRALKREVILKLTHESYRILMVSDVDRMTIAASNSLLKLLEEPPDGTILLLTTSNVGKLLSTLISRCQIIRLSPLPETEIEDALITRWNIPPEKARPYAKMATGSLRRALSFDDEAFEAHREAALLFLEQTLIPDEIIRLNASDRLLRLKDKAVIADVFQLIHSLVRDWLMIQMHSTERTIHLDVLNRIQTLHSQHPKFKTQDALGHVSRAIDFIEKNVYLDLIVLNLSQDLQQCMF
jgi:DNA polymerase-3 subunit delta'